MPQGLRLRILQNFWTVSGADGREQTDRIADDGAACCNRAGRAGVGDVVDGAAAICGDAGEEADMADRFAGVSGGGVRGDGLVRGEAGLADIVLRAG
jgi:hypothetical protein